MVKNKVILIMPGEVGFYLRNHLPVSLAKSKKIQGWFSHLFKNKVTLPLSLLAIAPYLENEGFEVVIIDGRVEDATVRIAEELDDSVLYIGISALTGSMIAYGLYCSEVVRQLRPNVPIIWGGVHVTLSPEQSLATSKYVDIVVRGEGELTAVELAKAIRDRKPLSTVDGLSWKCGNEVVHNQDRELMNFSEQLDLNYDLIDIRKYDTKNVLIYQSERGCPHRCSFCDVVIVHRRKFRQKSAEQVIRDINNLYDKFHPERIQLVDDCFFADMKRAKQVIEGFIKINRGFSWHASCRVQYAKHTDQEFWKRAKESGLTEVYVGAESGSQRILDYIKKDCRVEDIYRCAEQITAEGILFWTNFMMGFPNEKREDIDETIKMVDYLCDTYGENVRIGRIFIYAPCPGTPLHDEVVKCGFIPPKTLEGWGQFRIGDPSHTQWHPDIDYLSAVSVCSRYGRNLEGLGVVDRMSKGFRKYSIKLYLRLLVLKFPEFIRTVLARRASRKWVRRKFHYAWDLKALRWINVVFDTW